MIVVRLGGLAVLLCASVSHAFGVAGAVFTLRADGELAVAREPVTPRGVAECRP